MKNLLLPFAALAFLSLPAPAEDEEHTPLGKKMEEATDHYKALRRLAEGDWTGRLETLRKIKKPLLDSLAFEPATLGKIADEKEKALALADYQRLVAASYAALCQLEVAALQEDEDAFQKALAEIKALKKEGHNKHIEDED